MSNKELRVNSEITASQVHLILNDGQSRGTVSINEALQAAHQANLDLVEISPKAEPPVVRVIDYNKFRYEQEKRSRQSAKLAKNPQLKEIRLSYGIGAHDLETKARRAKEFLEAGNFVKVYIQLRGRQNIFPQIARGNLENFQKVLDADLEQEISHIGNRVSLVIKTKRNVKKLENLDAQERKT